MNKIVDRPWSKGGKYFAPTAELRREIQTGVTEQVGVAAITFAMNADDCNSGFKRIDDNNVTAPYIGCRETFRFVTEQAIARCKQMARRLHAQLRGARRRRLGSSVIRRLREQRDFYIASNAAWSTFRDGVLRRWDRAYDPTIGRSARVEINTNLSNYANWVLRALIRDNVFVARWNSEFFADVRNRRAPQPTKKQLKDHIASAEIAALGAYQSGGNSKDTKKDTKKDKSKGKGDVPNTRRDLDACPHPSAHVLFAGTCYRCGATDHMTPTCPFPKEEADMTPAQLAKYKAIKSKREAASKKRDDWYKARRNRRN
jgi:hypothetical protein